MRTILNTTIVVEFGCLTKKLTDLLCTTNWSKAEKNEIVQNPKRFAMFLLTSISNQPVSYDVEYLGATLSSNKFSIT